MAETYAPFSHHYLSVFVISSIKPFLVGYIFHCIWPLCFGVYNSEKLKWLCMTKTMWNINQFYILEVLTIYDESVLAPCLCVCVRTCVCVCMFVCGARIRGREQWYRETLPPINTTLNLWAKVEVGPNKKKIVLTKQFLHFHTPMRQNWYSSFYFEEYNTRTISLNIWKLIPTNSISWLISIEWWREKVSNSDDVLR